MRATMLCPQCRSEYRTGFHVCSDCQVALIPKLPELHQPLKLLPYVVVGIAIVAGVVIQSLHSPAVSRVFYWICIGMALLGLLLRFVFKLRV